MRQHPKQILIPGSGPTGLAMAAVLAKLGHRPRIIDKNTERTDKSKALGVQAGTLMCLEAALGPELPQRMIDAGRKVQRAQIHIDQRKAPIIADLSHIPGPHNFILMLAQSETERLFEEYLRDTHGIQVERQTELIEATQDPTQVIALLKNLQTGQTETVSTTYLLGCDGAHSITRWIAGIPFEGSTYTGDFILGDVDIEWPWDYGDIRIFVIGDGAMAAFPLHIEPGKEARYRLVFMAKGPAPDSPDISLDELRKLTTHFTSGRITIQSAHWLTRFRVHHRMVSRFQEGRIFLCGDAAHIHSPTGGQGMNTGIQDALNLGFKLDAVLRGKRPESSLGDYQKERMPVARQVLRGADFVSKLALREESPMLRFTRNYVLPHIIGSKWLQKQVFAGISEVAIARQEIERYTRD